MGIRTDNAKVHSSCCKPMDHFGKIKVKTHLEENPDRESSSSSKKSLSRLDEEREE